ncbi:uncharacterized protein LOC141597409 [Silene latifolia]|uniref:uncharacterized protein LOC141597409 n=1 Tax=Silene latifolia TaxID=37657 RepID=UPI003D78A05A
MTLYDSFTAWINSLLACIGLEPSSSWLRQSAGEPRINDHQCIEQHCQGQFGCAHGFSESFWSSSTGDLAYAFSVSQRSISSLSTLNLSFHSDMISGRTNSRNDYVNHGLRLWNQTRLWWVGGIKSSNEVRLAQEQAISLLSSKERFRRPIPLSEMVDYLVEGWEQEGFYD